MTKVVKRRMMRRRQMTGMSKLFTFPHLFTQRSKTSAILSREIVILLVRYYGIIKVVKVWKNPLETEKLIFMPLST
jgi:hypothetical protein